MLKTPIESLNILLTTLQSDITPTSHPFSSYELRHTNFYDIKKVQYVERKLGKELLPHHIICLITRKISNGRLFSCVYLINILTVEIVGFCRISGPWRNTFRYYADNEGYISIEVYIPSDGFYFTNIQITYSIGIYSLIER